MTGTWTLVSRKLSDGLDCLSLKSPEGLTFCEYAPGTIPYQDYWHSYMNGFPKKEFTSREACVADAERIAGHALEPLRKVTA